MVQELPRRTTSSGPALIRLLARLTDADISESRQALPDRLSQWLGWTDAIALAAVLNGPVAMVPATARNASSAFEDEYARVRASLETAIRGGTPSRLDRRPGKSAPLAQRIVPASDDVTFSTYRRRYVSLQQTMETSIAALRSRMRTMLAAKGTAMARLAGLDAAMEQALSEREMTLLAAVPTLLEAYFERLKQAATPENEPATTENQPATTGNEPVQRAASASPDAWLEVFHKTMHSVMLAELDIRLQPVEGLLKALRAG